jgi:hypothetical protein
MRRYAYRIFMLCKVNQTYLSDDPIVFISNTHIPLCYNFVLFFIFLWMLLINIDIKGLFFLCFSFRRKSAGRVKQPEGSFGLLP